MLSIQRGGTTLLYDHYQNKYMDETAQGMVDLVNETGEPVFVFWGDDVVTASPGESASDVLVQLEMSADFQQAEAFSEEMKNNEG